MPLHTYTEHHTVGTSDVTLREPLRAAGPHCLASDAGPRRPAGTVGTQLSRAVTGLLPGGQ